MKTKGILTCIFILHFFIGFSQDPIVLVNPPLDTVTFNPYTMDVYPKEPMIIGVEYEKTDGIVYAFIKVQMPTPAMSSCGPKCYQISIIKKLNADVEHFTVLGRNSGVATDRKKIFIYGMEYNEPKDNHDTYLGSIEGFRYSAKGKAKDNISAQVKLVQNSLSTDYDLFSANPATLKYFQGESYTHYFDDGEHIYSGYNLAKKEDIESYNIQKQNKKNRGENSREYVDGDKNNESKSRYSIDTRKDIPAQGIEQNRNYIRLGTYYGKDDRYGYFEDKPIKGSDGKTFQFYGLDFSRDVRHVYHAGKILTGANPKENYKIPIDDSFMTIGETNVYYQDVKTGLDPATYVKTGFSYYKDQYNVMYRDYKNGKPVFIVVKGADPASFIALDEFYKKQKRENPIYGDANYYGKDHHYIYYDGKRIDNSDAATFEFLTRNYARDKNNVYYEGKPIEYADPKTFHCIDDDGHRWMDKKNTFEHGQKVNRIKSLDE